MNIENEKPVSYDEALEDALAAKEWVRQRGYSEVWYEDCVVGFEHPEEPLYATKGDSFRICSADHRTVTGVDTREESPVAELVRRHGYEVVSLPKAAQEFISALEDIRTAKEWLRRRCEVEQLDKDYWIIADKNKPYITIEFWSDPELEGLRCRTWSGSEEGLSELISVVETHQDACLTSERRALTDDT